MAEFRTTTPLEREQILQRGTVVENWEQLFVSEDFNALQLFASHLSGTIYLDSCARIFSSSVSNYAIGKGALIDGVVRMECSEISSFGNGVEVAPLNENGGRTIKIFSAMSAQTAYLATIYRHNAQLVERLEKLVDEYATEHSASIGEVGAESQIVGVKIIRNVRFGARVRVEGSSWLSNATLLDGAYCGVDVKARDFIAVENSRVDNGATIERCFVGENVILSNGFTAVDSLFFASSHCENGEAASIFAGPYTVSHHKSSLLIAGMFSFFNAGSGSNQSNHLFKCGPVHQGVHMRGCKFGSSAYVMLPAIDGAFTTVIGSHSSHHDTSDFPFSYLINKDGRSMLLPATNLSSYGYVRDVEKWIKRDKRTIKRDIVSLDEHNPYITEMMVRGVNAINTLYDKGSSSELYIHGNVAIRESSMRRALTLYNKGIASSIGAMLSLDAPTKPEQGRGKWLDVAGQYITQQSVEEIVEQIIGDQNLALCDIDAHFKEFERHYLAYAYDWAMGLLTQLLGHNPSAEEVEQAIAASQRSRDELMKMALRDKQKDNVAAMMLSYGLDSDDSALREADFNAVRGL